MGREGLPLQHAVEVKGLEGLGVPVLWGDNVTAWANHGEVRRRPTARRGGCRCRRWAVPGRVTRQKGKRALFLKIHVAPAAVEV